MDIIERLEDNELYVDAVDDAIQEIQMLRAQLEHARGLIQEQVSAAEQMRTTIYLRDQEIHRLREVIEHALGLIATTKAGQDIAMVDAYLRVNLDPYRGGE